MSSNSGSAWENDRPLRFSDCDVDAQNDLIRQYQGLVNQIARRLKRKLPPHIRLDDLTAAGQVGLWQALQSYASDRNIPFERYAPIRIRGAMIDEIRKSGPKRQMESTLTARARQAYGSQQHAYISLDDEEHDHYEWIVDEKAVSPEEAAVQSGVVAELNRAIIKLPQQEQLILSLVFIEGLTLAESAEVLSLSRSRVSTLYSGALKSLKGSMLRMQRR